MRALFTLCGIVCAFVPRHSLAYEGGRFAPTSQPVQKAPQLTKEPTVREFVAAEYPESERGKGTVNVVLLLYLDAEGNVTKAQVHDAGAASQAFVDAAIAAGKKLKFTPAEVDGKPSPIGWGWRYRFTEDMAAETAPASAPASAPVTDDVAAQTPAGTAAIKGEVREAGTRLRLADVAVRVEIGTFGADTTTDEKGRFVFRGLPAGMARVTVVSLNHRKRSLTYTLERDVELSERNIYLQPQVFNPFETIVQGKREEREVTKRVITRDELIKVPGSFGDPLRAVQNLPSVARPPLLGGALIIRGASPNSSEFYIDGMKLPALYHFGPGPSIIQESFIEDISFFPCCFSARYGRATAGIIEVGLRKPDIRKWSGKASADLMMARLFTEFPITEKTSLQLAARRSYIDALLGPVLNLVNPPIPGQIQNPLILPVFWDYQGRLLHESTRFGDFSIFVFGSDDRFKFSQTPSQQTSALNPSAAQISLTNHSIQPKWHLKITPNLSNTLTLQGNLEINGGASPDSHLDIKEWNLGVRDEMKLRVSDTLSFLFGGDANFSRTDITAKLPILPKFPEFPTPGTEAPPTTDFSSRQAVHEIGWYAEADIRFGKLRLLPGARLEQITYVGRMRQGLTPRLSVRYKVIEPLELKAAVGTFQKRPFLPNIVQSFGNPDLQLESALHSTLGFQWNITQALSLEMSAFANYLWDEATTTSRVILQSDGTLRPLINDNRQVGRVFGGELLLRHKPYKNFYGWIAYTLSRSERKTDGDWFLFNFDQTHILIIVASYILPYGFQVGTRFRLISGNPTTPTVRVGPGAVPSVYDADTADYRRVNAPFRSGRLPLFHQLDVRIDKKFALPWFMITVYLDVQNVYNAENSEFYQFSYDFSRQQAIRSIPILPILGVEGEW